MEACLSKGLLLLRQLCALVWHIGIDFGSNTETFQAEKTTFHAITERKNDVNSNNNNKPKFRNF